MGFDQVKFKIRFSIFFILEFLLCLIIFVSVPVGGVYIWDIFYGPRGEGMASYLAEGEGLYILRWCFILGGGC